MMTEYEEEKEKLKALDLTPEEYQREIRKLCERLNI